MNFRFLAKQNVNVKQGIVEGTCPRIHYNFFRNLFTTNIYFLYTDDMYFINKGTLHDTDRVLEYRTKSDYYSPSKSDDPFFIWMRSIIFRIIEFYFWKYPL